MSEQAEYECIRDWRDLEVLPVGTVVMARHKSHGDTWPWVKTDDTELLDDDGERRNRAWACVAYTEDRSDADLLIQSDAVVMVWDGAHTLPRPTGGKR